MEVIYLDEQTSYQLPSNTNLCLGMFDGLHLGHQELFKLAHQDGYKTAVLTFTNSPKSLFNNREENMITPLHKKLVLLNECNVDIVIVKTFDSQFANIKKNDFIDAFLRKLSPGKLVAGFDYHFGYHAEGTIDDLKKVYEVIECPKFIIDNNKVSTSDILELIETKKIDEVRKYLGRYYSIVGSVQKGLQNGRKIDFPTINIKLKENYVVPAKGVYIGQVLIKGRIYQCMINIGTHPTIDELEKPLIEAHILDFKEDIYNEEIELYFIKFIRDEIRFNSFDELKRQLQKDIKLVNEFFTK